MSTVSAIAAAIQKQEGWFPGSVSQRSNNPGNIMDLSYYQQTGQFRVQQYATLADGQAAMEALISRNIAKGLTLEEMIGGKPGVYAGWAPAGHGDNNPTAYAAAVSAMAGIPVDVPLNTLTGAGGGGALYIAPPVDTSADAVVDVGFSPVTLAAIAAAAVVGVVLFSNR